MEYNVVTLYNKLNAFFVNVYQIDRSVFKIKVQIGHHSYSYDYVDNMYDLARTCFCFLINGYELLSNHLGFEFAHSIHTGIFSDFQEKIEEKKIEGTPLRRSPFRSAYQEDDVHDPDDEPPEIKDKS